MTNIDQIISSAQEEAQAVAPDTTAAVPAVHVEAAPAPAANLPAHLQAYAAPMKIDMETAQGMGGMLADAWLKPGDQGLCIDESGLIIDPIKATIEMVEGAGFTVAETIRVSPQGETAEYFHTYDRVTANDGRSWIEVLQYAMTKDPKARPYMSAQLLFTAKADIKDITGSVVAKEGDTIGYATPVTTWQGWVKFFKEVNGKGLMGTDVGITLGHRPRKNKRGQTWGELTFALDA